MLLGHVILEKGISIDLERVEAIRKSLTFQHQKSLDILWGRSTSFESSSLGMCEIVKPLMEMMKEDDKIKWVKEEKKALHDLEEAISRESILTKLDYGRSFYLYFFALECSIVGILIQKYKEDMEKPISFMSTTLIYVH